MVWDGDPECEHEWRTSIAEHDNLRPSKVSPLTQVGSNKNLEFRTGKKVQNAFCHKCHAWRGQLGLEPTLDLYLSHLLQITAELKRVLKSTGVMFWNHGDCYHSGNKRMSNWTSNNPEVQKWIGKKQSSESYKEHEVDLNIPVKSLCIQNYRLILKMVDIQGWILRNQIVWCLAGSTQLYAKTQKGEMPAMLKDLARLDPQTVQLWNGNTWTQVESWTPSGDKESLKITLGSGQVICCTPNHKWPTLRGLLNASELRIGDELRQVKLPEPEEQHNPKHLPDKDIGWFVGMYLAEGSRSGDCIQIASHIKETERYEHLKQIADSYDGTCKMYNTHNKSATINIHSDVLDAVIDTYIAGRIAKNKGLKMACWKRSNKFLRALLLGYLEGDGHWDAKNERWRIGFTRNSRLADDLQTLCARLNFVIRIKPVYTQIGRIRYAAYRGEIRSEWGWKTIKRSPNRIVKIERHETIEHYWDVEVEAENGEFALASGIITHNSKPNAMPSSVKDRFANKWEPVFMLTKNTKPQYYYNDKTLENADRKPKELMEGRDWDWVECPKCDGIGIVKDDKGEICKRCKGTGKVKHSYWHGLDVWFDLDAVRVAHSESSIHRVESSPHTGSGMSFGTRGKENAKLQEVSLNPSGKNPGDVFTIPTFPFPDAHFATFPPKLIEPFIKAACPQWICPVCEKARVRISKRITEPTRPGRITGTGKSGKDDDPNKQLHTRDPQRHIVKDIQTIGWTSCRCNADHWEAGIVLDPFIGSGTTGMVAKKLGRNYIGIDANPEYMAMARKRIAEVPLRLL